MTNVRKAVSLKSLGELNISKRAQRYLEGRFPSLSSIIFHGRLWACEYADFPQGFKSALKSTLELINALDEAGYIRHDINSGSFGISRLYRMVYPTAFDNINAPFDLLCERVRIWDGTVPDYSINNELYESFQIPSETQVEELKSAIKPCLNDDEYAFVMYRYGFEDGKTHSLEDVENRMRLSWHQARGLDMKVLNKLRRSDVLPKNIAASGKQVGEVNAIINEIEELRKDPYKREAELRWKLFEITKTPFTHASYVKEYLDCINGQDSSEVKPHLTDIGYLGLSARTYNCLKRAKIDTLADVLSCPKERWSKVRNFGLKNIAELIEKVRAVGYPDFDIDIS